MADPSSEGKQPPLGFGGAAPFAQFAKGAWHNVKPYAPATDSAHSRSPRGAFPAKFSSFPATPRRDPRAPARSANPLAPAPEKPDSVRAPRAASL